MATIGEERERLRVELHKALENGQKTIAETLRVQYDPQHKWRQKFLALASNMFLAIAGSKFRAKIIKGDRG